MKKLTTTFEIPGDWNVSIINMIGRKYYIPDAYRQKSQKELADNSIIVTGNDFYLDFGSHSPAIDNQKNIELLI